jgi:hypothetical protein
LDHFDIGDDLDDSALVYLTTDQSIENARVLHHKMGEHANGRKRSIRNTFPEFRSLPAYSTWFGTSRMPIEFDFCVLCNVLCFVSRYGLPFNKYDKASLTFIKGVISDRRFVTAPYNSSPNYGSSALIVYHFARLATELEEGKLKVEIDIVKDWIRESVKGMEGSTMESTDDFGVESTDDYGEQLLLFIAYLKLGGDYSPEFEPTIRKIKASKVPSITYFIAGLLGTQENLLLRRLAVSPLSHIRYSSIAINLALLIEARSRLDLAEGAAGWGNLGGQ